MRLDVDRRDEDTSDEPAQLSHVEYAGKRKKTRREVFLEEMELVVPWKVALKII